jgi:cell division GTPase FtsZ
LCIEKSHTDKENGDGMEKNQIVIVGAGGCGVNSVHRLIKTGLKGCELVTVDSDAEQLGAIKDANTVLLINPEADLSRIAGKLTELSIIFVLNGAGGKAGCESALMLAKLAKERKARVISIITRPFALERRRCEKAPGFIASMRKVADEVIIRDNNALVKHMPDKEMKECFNFMDNDLGERISAFADSKNVEAGSFFTGWMYEG